LPEGRLCAWDRELKDLWTYPARSITGKQAVFDRDEIRMQIGRARMIDRVIPPSYGRPGEVISGPAMAIEAATGRPLWTGQAALVPSESLDLMAAAFAPKLLDPGDSARLPRLIGNGLGATVCREAMPTNAEGLIVAPRGRVWVPRALGAPDPRWTRALPWRTWMKGLFGPRAAVAAGGLALVNVVLPLLVLRLVVGRRRAFRMWALMVVPVAAVVPLMVYLSLVSWLPVGEQSWLGTEQRVFLFGTLAGVPVVLGVWWVIVAVVRGRWRRLVAMAGLVVVATMLVAGAWIWVDRKAMAGIERYGWEGWELVFLAGAYGAAVLWGLGRVALGGYRLVRRRRL
jgi:hypothetical protein